MGYGSIRNHFGPKNFVKNFVHIKCAGKKILLKNVRIENNQNCGVLGVYVTGGAKLDATECQFHQKRVWGVHDWIHDDRRDDRPSHSSSTMMV